MPEPLRIAFLGCGRITARHAKLLRSIGGVALRFASRDAAKAAAFAARHGGEASHGSYQSAIDDPAVQVVVVATPPDAHRDLALAALAAGRDVVIEKPAFVSSHDGEPVAAAARESGRQVLVAENYRYRPLLRTLQRLLADGVIGELRLVQIDAVKRQADPAWLDATMPGALWEGGIHWIHFLASLGPNIAEMRGFQPAPPGRPERTMLAVARFAGGGVGTLAYSWEVPSPLQGLRMSHIYGTAGVIGFESNGLFVRVHGRKQRLLFPGFRDISGYRAMWIDFLAALRGGHTASMTLDLAMRDLALVEHCYRSAQAPITGDSR